MSLRPGGLVKKSSHTDASCQHGSHQRTERRRRRWALAAASQQPKLTRLASMTRASDEPSQAQHASPTHKAQRRRRRDAAPTDKLADRARARPGARPALEAPPLSPQSRSSRPSIYESRRRWPSHGETNNHKRNNWRRLLRLCGRLVSFSSLVVRHGRRRDHS